MRPSHSYVRSCAGSWRQWRAPTAEAIRVHKDYEDGRYADVCSHVMEQRERRPTITSDIRAKEDVTPEGNPRAAAWDQGHAATLENVDKVSAMSPASVDVP